LSKGKWRTARGFDKLSPNGWEFFRVSLKEAMLLLIANDGPLGPEWQDHPLGGDWDGHRECHIGGDFLLAYKLDDSSKIGLVVFVRTGTHAELFQ
jgi:mRNA interferase YafQ